MVQKTPEETNVLEMLQFCVLRMQKDGKIYQLGNLLCSLPHLQLITLIIVQDIFRNRFFDAKEHVNIVRATGNIKLIRTIREVMIMFIKSF